VQGDLTRWYEIVKNVGCLRYIHRLTDEYTATYIHRLTDECNGLCLSVAAIFLGSGIDEYVTVIFLVPRNIEAPRNVPYFPIVKARFLKKMSVSPEMKMELPIREFEKPKS
jgi:hypothetical protein